MKEREQFTFETMINAAKSNDSSYDGKFWLGVKSTKIYCLPSCRARFPLQKNIIFFSTREEAITKGFRGCKRCMSESYPDTKPRWLDIIIDFLQNNSMRKITIDEISELVEVDITTIRRYFKEYFGSSPMTYHRKLRLSYAKKKIREGAEIEDISKIIGFSSIEGFMQAYEKEYGYSPKEELNER